MTYLSSNQSLAPSTRDLIHELNPQLNHIQHPTQRTDPPTDQGQIVDLPDVESRLKHLPRETGVLDFRQLLESHDGSAAGDVDDEGAQVREAVSYFGYGGAGGEGGEGECADGAEFGGVHVEPGEVFEGGFGGEVEAAEGVVGDDGFGVDGVGG
jgi:hypothetical protein